MKSGSTSSLVYHLQARLLFEELIGALAVIAALAWVPARADFLPCMGSAGTTCMTFVNHTNMTLNYTVDGKPVASLPAGGEGSRVVQMGSHIIAAQQGDGSTVSSKGVSLGKGPSSWTLSGGGPGPSGACLADEQCAQVWNEGVNTPVSSELAGDFYAGNNLAFKPGSSIPLTFHPTQALPANTTCTPVYTTVTTYSAEGGVRKVPARIVGNHLVFGPDTGEFIVQGHCLENPNIVSAPIQYKSSLNPDAINIGEAFAAGLERSAVPNGAMSSGNTESTAPASNASSSGGSGDALLIGGLIAGAAVIAVAAGAAAKSSSGGSGGGGQCSNTFAVLTGFNNGQPECTWNGATGQVSDVTCPATYNGLPVTVVGQGQACNVCSEGAYCSNGQEIDCQAGLVCFLGNSGPVCSTASQVLSACGQ